jgi:hypothetical protein
LIFNSNDLKLIIEHDYSHLNQLFLGDLFSKYWSIHLNEVIDRENHNPKEKSYALDSMNEKILLSSSLFLFMIRIHQYCCPWMIISQSQSRMAYINKLQKKKMGFLTYLGVTTLGVIGFAVTGPVAGSVAAIIQSSVYGGTVTAGSLFSIAQSIAMAAPTP